VALSTTRPLAFPLHDPVDDEEIDVVADLMREVDDNGLPDFSYGELARMILPYRWQTLMNTLLFFNDSAACCPDDPANVHNYILAFRVAYDIFAYSYPIVKLSVVHILMS